MLRHVVLFRWKAGVSASEVDAVAVALGRLPATIPTVRGYRFGADAGINDGNADFAVVADFDDVDGYLTYRDHPAHQAVIAELIAPNVVERTAVQYVLDG